MNGNKLVAACIADIHMYDKNAWPLLEELRSEFLEPLRKMGNKLDAVFILGDLFHGKVSMNGAAASAVLQFMNELADITEPRDITVRVLKGTATHDHSMLNALSFLGARGIEVYNDVTTEDIEVFIKGVLYEFSILYLPEEYPKDWREYYGNVLPPRDGIPYDIILGHGMVDFAAFSSLLLESERPIKSAVVFPTDLLVRSGTVSVFGHVHVAQSNKSVHYCGSFSRIAFGEEQPKGWLLLEMDAETSAVRITRKRNKKAPEYRTLSIFEVMQEDEEAESALEKIGPILEKSRLRLTVDSEVSPEMSSKISVLREHFSGDDRFRIERRLLKKKTVSEGAEDDGLDFVRKKELPVDETIHRHISGNKPNLGITLEDVRGVISPKR